MLCSALSPKIIHKKVNIVVSGTCALAALHMVFVAFFNLCQQIIVKSLERDQCYSGLKMKTIFFSKTIVST